MNDIEKQAMQSLTDNYEGNDEEIYFGFNDLSLQFEGAQSSFANEGKKGLNFAMTIENNDVSAEDQVIAICPAYYADAANIKDSNGNAVNAIISEGYCINTTDKKVKVTGNPKSADEFLSYIKVVPTRVTGLKLLVDDPEQLEEAIYIRQISPFRNLADRIITPSDYKDSTQTDDKRCEIPLDHVQFDNQTVMIIKVKAGRTISLNWFIGAMRNPAYELDRKAKKAMENIHREYGN